MDQMKKARIIRALKLLIGVTTFGLWAKMLYEVIHFHGGFQAQLPYCIAGTMLIFGIATGVYKGLEAWERRA